MPEFSNTIIELSRRAVAEQGGLLNGKDPTAVNLADPLPLWIIQVGLIIATASLLSLALRRIRQPKVIAEVLGGILLGPTALGRIPGFTQHIFPDESRPFLNLTANVGLCLFLFLVGLEIDAGVIKRNAKLSLAVSFAGMALPFGLGTALSKSLFNQFISDGVQYTHFMLFTGVAYSITAFPVLCRILTELKLLDTTVGIVVLSAGVGNDIVGWILLALSVALVNAGSGLMALYILLTCVGWTIFLLFPVKYALRWLAKQTGSIENGPTLFFMTVTIMVMLGSAFFTDIIGVHAIFGAFVTGLIVPREGGLTIALTEKLEDMVAIIFLPLYFTLSGLSTNLGLLNNGITWGFTIAIISLAFTGKFGGCTLAARYLARFNWRESATIGSLMSCKGLVELIVLNVGLSAGILNQRVFSMFVLEALVLTFLTTPLVTTLYPPKYRVRISKTGANFNNVADSEAGAVDAKALKNRTSQSHSSQLDGFEEEKIRFTVVLDKLEHLSGAMAVAQLLNPLVRGFEDEVDANQDPHDSDGKNSSTDRIVEKIHIQPKGSSGRKSPTPSAVSSSTPSMASSLTIVSPIINALRLIKLSDRVSAVMKSHDKPTLLHSDPVLSIYRMFALLQGINVFSELDVVPEEEMAECTLEKANSFGAEMIVIPWVIHNSSSIINVLAVSGLDGWQTPKEGNPSHNPFDALFRTGEKDGITTPNSIAPSAHGGFGFWSWASGASVIHSHYIRTVFARSDIDVGLYIDQSGVVSSSVRHDVNDPMAFAAVGLSGAGKGRGRVHIFLPFFGGPDDRLALEFVVSLCRRNEHMRATVVRLRKVEESVPVTSPIGAEIGEKDGVLEIKNEEINDTTVASSAAGFPDTIYGPASTEIRLLSAAADDITWAQYATPQSILRKPDSSSSSNPSDLAQSPHVPRVSFKEITTIKPLHAALDEAFTLQQLSNTGSKPRGYHIQDTSTSPAAGVGVVIVTGRSRRLAVESHRAELKELMQEDAGGGWEAAESGVVRDIRQTVGEVASAFVGRGVGVGVWVLQTSLNGEKQ